MLWFPTGLLTANSSCGGFFVLVSYPRSGSDVAAHRVFLKSQFSKPQVPVRDGRRYTSGFTHGQESLCRLKMDCAGNF